MIIFLCIVTILITTTALATFVATRAWNYRPARLFLLVFATLIAVSLGTIFQVQAPGGLLVQLGVLLTLPGLAAMSWSLLLLLSALFVPQWWEGTRLIRWISAPYILATVLIAGDLLGRFGLFISSAATRTPTPTPLGWILVGAFSAGWLVHLGLLGTVFARRPETRRIIAGLLATLIIDLVIGEWAVLVPFGLDAPQLRSALSLAETLTLLAPLAYAVIRLEPTRTALDTALQALTEAVAVLDREGTIVYANPSAGAFGLQPNQTFATALRDAQVPEDEVALLVTQQAHPPVLPITETLHVGDPVRLVQVTLTPVTDNGGQARGTLVLGRDITELERRNTLLEEERTQLDAAVNQLSYLAQHDPLTGLPNRRSLSEALERGVAHARRGTESVLFFIDLDNFKLVNDTLGHAAGDQLLTTIGQLLAEKLRDGDLLARLGGDEFAILLEDTKLDQALPVAERIRAQIEMFRFVRDGRSFELGLSIGVVPVDGSVSAQVVLTHADIAMYTAKERGRNQVALYQPNDDGFAQLTAAHQWVPRIKDALASDRFVLHFQPVVRLSDGHTTHHEVLLRMIEPDGQLVYPNAFLPAAERFGLMPALDHWMIGQTIRTLQTHPHDQFFVNVSGRSLGNEALLPFIETSLRQCDVAPGRLGFEITETTVSQDAIRFESWIRQVTALGCRFALGDFGTGGTSFATLRNLRVDQIKIDGSFIRSLDSDPRSRDIVRAMHLLAQSFGKETVAEFVETDAIRGIVQEMGLTYGQGFTLGKPGPAVTQANMGGRDLTWSAPGHLRELHP